MLIRTVKKGWKNKLGLANLCLHAEEHEIENMDLETSGQEQSIVSHTRPKEIHLQHEGPRPQAET